MRTFRIVSTTGRGAALKSLPFPENTDEVTLAVVQEGLSLTVYYGNESVTGLIQCAIPWAVKRSHTIPLGFDIPNLSVEGLRAALAHYGYEALVVA